MLPDGSFGRPAIDAETQALRSVIGRRMRAVRDRLGWSQARMADELESAQSSLSNYERGVGMPPEVLLRFMVITRTRPQWLLFGIGEPRAD